MSLARAAGGRSQGPAGFWCDDARHLPLASPGSDGAAPQIERSALGRSARRGLRLAADIRCTAATTAARAKGGALYPFQSGGAISASQVRLLLYDLDEHLL